ncbi:MAG TPA: hypothetical protein VF601_10695 [Beijerinckiaceae bacterium]|jgi:hypothetical protein
MDASQPSPIVGRPLHDVAPHPDGHRSRQGNPPSIASAVAHGAVPLAAVIVSFFAIHLFVFRSTGLWDVLSVAYHVFAELYKDRFEFIFALAILVSLWIQGTVTSYFEARELLRVDVKVFGNSLVVPLILGFLVQFCMLTIDKGIWAHVISNWLYLVAVLIIDLVYWKASRSIPGYEDKHECLQVRCKRLLWFIDVPSVVAIFVLALVAYLIEMPLTDATNALNESDKGELQIAMKRKYLSGVMAYHLFLSACIILLLLFDWESQARRADSENLR